MNTPKKLTKIKHKTHEVVIEMAKPKRRLPDQLNPPSLKLDAKDIDEFMADFNKQPVKVTPK